ncbi:hypothetical protein [Porphyrobacter sp. AAP82]|uniref:hypothetical protein n=1 Tax=Porphyrobacter sp. AAP82 TaxID=1248917 RepID=UPI0012DD838F|nr:hypothetical protein [Porphyrobacter sp. AAP82]
MIGLAMTAVLLALIVDLLTAESAQSRRFISRGQAAVEQLQARRIFVTEAARATGTADARQLGALRILPDALVLQGQGSAQPVLRWTAGRASFSYSHDGSIWRSTSDDAESDIVRFTLQRGDQSHVWIAP